MLTPSSGTLADYNAAILNGNATHVRIVFPVQNKTFTDADITADGGITVNSILNGDTDLFMGKAVSREIIIHFLNNGQFTGFDWAEEFHVDFGVEISGSTNWVTVGYFTGVKPERVTRTEVIEFTAKDCMGSKFDVLADDFIASLSFPMDLGSIYSALCAYVGITSATGDEDSTVMSSSYSENPFVNGVSCRQILAWIAEANCCYAKIDSSNKVKLVWFKDQTSNYSITGDDYFSINVDESATPDIDVIRVNSAEDENARYMHPVGGNGVEYQIVDNPLLLNMLATDRTTALTKMLARLNAVCGYIPMSVSAIGNWMVEEGDIIEVTYDEGATTENMPVFARSLQWNGGCNDVYECTGNVERTEMSASDRESYITGGKLSNKYTIQSGIDITDEGITVSGGKWVKIVSGGTFDVDSTNFRVSSVDKRVEIGDWWFYNGGLTRFISIYNNMFSIGEEIDGYDINTGISFLRESGNPYLKLYSAYNPTHTDPESAGFLVYGSYTPTPLVFRRVDMYLTYTGNGNGFIGRDTSRLRGYFKTLDSNTFSGSGVYNDLDQTSEGYVLDARQGKALNDAKLDKSNVVTVNGSLTFVAGSNEGNVEIQATNARNFRWVAMQNGTSAGNTYGKIAIAGINVQPNSIIVYADRTNRGNNTNALTISVIAIGVNI